MRGVGSDPVNPLMVILVMLVPMLMLLVEVVMLRGWRGRLAAHTHEASEPSAATTLSLGPDAAERQDRETWACFRQPPTHLDLMQADNRRTGKMVFNRGDHCSSLF